MSARLVQVLPVAWIAVVILAGWRFRPRSVRLPAGRRSRRPGPPSPGPVARLAGWFRRLWGRPPDHDADRRQGRALLAALAGSVLDLRLGVAVAIAALLAPAVAARRERRRHRHEVLRELPEVIDLLRLSLAAGGSVQFAVAGLAEAPFGPITAGLGEATRSVRLGRRFPDTLDALVERVGDDVRPLVRAMAGAEHYGTELLPTLERLSGDARERRRREAQAAARRVPIRLLLPLVVCILPAFVLLTLVPTLAGTLDGIGL